MSAFIREGIAMAGAEKAAAVLLELDTPGGLLDSTREIVQSMLNSPLPVIVYTAPQGARATSAGVFIMMASDVAAMSPGTHLGAAHPVSIGGGSNPLKKKPGDSPGKGQGSPGSKADSKEDDSGSVMGEKAVSDAAAYVRALAADKGRNAEWAERAVRESVSLTSKEALAQGVIEIVAADRSELFKSLEGRKISKHGREMRISLGSAVVREFPMGALRKIRQIIANPNLLMVFMMLGIYGLMYEFSSPGVGFGAIVGVVSLILAAYAMSILPVNYAGLLLILLAIVLLGLEFQMPTHGLLAVGGLTLLALGSFFLFDTAELYLRVSLKVIGATVVSTGAFFFFVIGKLLKARRLKPAVGAETIVGQVGEARETLDPKGMVSVDGVLWSAEAASRLNEGTRVKVLEVRGNILRVEKFEEVRHD
jgi:membrane-bound serine protease (ClpP class)